MPGAYLGVEHLKLLQPFVKKVAYNYLQPNTIFVGKAISLPWSGAPERSSALRLKSHTLYHCPPSTA